MITTKWPLVTAMCLKWIRSKTSGTIIGAWLPDGSNFIYKNPILKLRRPKWWKVRANRLLLYSSFHSGTNKERVYGYCLGFSVTICTWVNSNWSGLVLPSWPPRVPNLEWTLVRSLSRSLNILMKGGMYKIFKKYYENMVQLYRHCFSTTTTATFFSS